MKFISVLETASFCPTCCFATTKVRRKCSLDAALRALFTKMRIFSNHTIDPVYCVTCTQIQEV